MLNSWRSCKNNPINNHVLLILQLNFIDWSILYTTEVTKMKNTKKCIRGDQGLLQGPPENKSRRQRSGGSQFEASPGK
jgi:hypothetical protein